ncbi:MAG TPA: DEAD/DEAH box helicase [Chitinophagaceae bacterium]|nr:MAG: DEAD/DEAH box helicase [Bacteroidetes bacterium OLB11]HMN33032.1 DEAD/DEAH box helicase [Chitinophagaceae bacterium]
MTENFNELGLHEQLLLAIQELGFEHPTEIQQKAIPVFLKREKNLLALAQTGTGKTAAFGLPILHNLDLQNKSTQALIISPTRELCLQITNDLKNYSKFQKGLNIVAVYGGSSISNQIKDIKRGAQIIVATPGRLIDLLDRKAVKLNQIETVVLDEADEMLNMGFQEDMETILSQTPDEKITGLFSATMPKEIRNIANQYLNDAVEVSVGKKNTASADITHQYAVVQAKDKFAALKRIIDFNDDFFGIIFCTTKIQTQEISDALMKAGYNADCLHGDLSQQQRDKVMGKFRKRVIQVLCATDVAARGIDVNNITHVIHYHLPDDIENYTHRSGRTARAGKKGTSIALLHVREAYKLHQIERLAGVKFERFLIPKGEEIIDKTILNYLQNIVDFDQEESSPIEIKNKWKAKLYELSHEQLIQNVISLKLAHVDVNYSSQEDLNIEESSKSSKEKSKSSSSNFGKGERYRNDKSSTRMFVNLGKKDNLRYDELREFIFKTSKVSGHHIKDIEMKGVYSFFETDENSAQRILESFKRNISYKDRNVRIQIAGEGDDDYKHPSHSKNEHKSSKSFNKKDNHLKTKSKVKKRW